MKKTKTNNKIEVRKFNIKLIVTHRFGYYQNATNVAMALAQAGRYVNIRQEGSTYLVDIYEIDNN